MQGKVCYDWHVCIWSTKVNLAIPETLCAHTYKLKLNDNFDTYYNVRKMPPLKMHVRIACEWTRRVRTYVGIMVHRPIYVPADPSDDKPHIYKIGAQGRRQVPVLREKILWDIDIGQRSRSTREH